MDIIPDLETPAALRPLPEGVHTVAVMGLGYVGLPLVIEFGKRISTLGFDVDAHKVRCCSAGHDPSQEISDELMAQAVHARYTTEAQELARADVLIVAVPTPVDAAHIPDFGPLVQASTTLGRHLKRGALVVFESTVYPGATQEVCIPAIESASGLQWGRDFHVGYSPERINPGDREHTLTRVLKIVSGDSQATLTKVAQLYEAIVEPGVHRASSIKTAEAAKVIENTQRDLNIALMNELALIFDRMGIDTAEVLEAAGTKWNFLSFRPGLVGGHCIGVDPYYLTHKAVMMGYHPQVILAGRRINDGMGKYIAEQTVKHMIAGGSAVKGARVNVLGLTFKENCADLRNTKVLDIVQELRSYGVEVFVTDPWAQPGQAMQECGVELHGWQDLPRADAVVVAVAHEQFKALSVEAFSSKLVNQGAFIDVKSIYDAQALRAAGYAVWRL